MEIKSEFCNRTPQVQEVILEITEKKECGDVLEDDLKKLQN